MASAITDLIDRVTDSTTGRPVISALASPKASGASSLSLTDATNWTTSSAIHFSIYETTAAGVKDPTTQTDWKGTLSTTTISNLTLTGGTDRAYSAGAKVEITPTARYAKDLYDNITTHANQDGTLKTTAVQQALNIATSSTDWTPLANTPTMVSSNGQKEHVIRYTGVDYSDRLQEGTKLKVPRTGTTPTTSMAFVAASSQYASKTSPTGLTFTNNFTCEAWIYLDSYGSANSSIITRTDAAVGQGFDLHVTAAGQVEMSGLATGGGRYITSYQSVPLNKWVHVAATLDMSGWTVATNKIYIDGVDVPIALNQFGTNPTALTQSGDLQISRVGTIGRFINGKAANIRIWSNGRTATEIRDNMNKETPASTTGLIGHWKGNGSWNDSSANANHLTAAGGAVNNFASHPYSAIEYAIATKVAYTGGNTDVTIFTGNGCLPNETLGTTNYSTARTPYGFPAASSKWRLSYTWKSGTGMTTASIAGTWGATTGSDVAIPTGVWRRNSAIVYTGGSSTAATFTLQSQWYNGSPGGFDSEGQDVHRANVATSFVVARHRHTETITKTAMSTEQLWGAITSGSGTQNAYFEGTNTNVMSLECAYL